MRIAIIDSPYGNLKSVYNALRVLGADAVIADCPEELNRASGIILPGVGSFGSGMAALRSGGYVEVLNKEVVEGGKPLLGICLGMQLLMCSSEESPGVDGLGWINGSVVKMKGAHDVRIPHIGWNDVCIESGAMYGEPSEDTEAFYFVHSYAVEPESPSCVSGWCDHGTRFVASVVSENIWGVQFHPEKSQKAGLNLLRRFIEVCSC